jgi:hypothetical protein
MSQSTQTMSQPISYNIYFTMSFYILITKQVGSGSNGTDLSDFAQSYQANARTAS